MTDSRPSRTPSESFTTMTELVLPQHANSVGTAFGGTVMSWVDICAAIAAQRHCGRVAVTARVDALEFHAPIRVGDTVCLEARLNAAFGSSMEIAVHVEREDRETRERTLCVDALLTFVHMLDGRPVPVPRLECENEDDRQRADAALARRDARLEARA